MYPSRGKGPRASDPPRTAGAGPEHGLRARVSWLKAGPFPCGNQMEHVPRGLHTSSNVDIMHFCPHSSPGRWRDRSQSQPQGRTGSRTGSLEPLAPSPRPPTLLSARDGGCLHWAPLSSPRLSGPRRSSPGSCPQRRGTSIPCTQTSKHCFLSHLTSSLSPRRVPWLSGADCGPPKCMVAWLI